MMSDSQKAAAWDKIALAWAVYQRQGAYVFDWDYDSRDLMDHLIGNDGEWIAGLIEQADVITNNGLTKLLASD